MEKTKVDVSKVIKELEVARNELKEGIINAKLTKISKENVANDLNEVIALAEQMKANLNNNKESK